MSSHPLQCYAC